MKKHEKQSKMIPKEENDMSNNKKENTGTTSNMLEMTQARLDAAKDLVRIKQSKGIKDAKLSIYEVLEEEIMKLDIPDKEKAARLSRLLKVRNKKVNIMLVGSTGVGKSSTIMHFLTRMSQRSESAWIRKRA